MEAENCASAAIVNSLHLQSKRTFLPMPGALLPLAVGMLPLNALVYVLDGVLVGASDFTYLAGGPQFSVLLARFLELWGAAVVLLAGYCEIWRSHKPATLNQ